MPRPGKGYTSKQWNALSAEEREHIKEENKRQYYIQYKREYYVANSEILLRRKKEAYARDPEIYRQRTAKYIQQKKEELERLKLQNEILQAKLNTIIV